MGNLLSNDLRVPVFKGTEGFKYQWALDYWETHDKMVWHFDEAPLSSDVIDYKKASKEEQEFITGVMKLFTQNEVMVGHGYDTMCRVFKPQEVLQMLRGENDRESTHTMAYSLFTETIGLGDKVYSEFLSIPAMATKTDYLEKAKVLKYEDYKRVGMTDAQVDWEFRRAVARMLAIYAGGTELISLFSQFAMLLQYQFDNKYKGLCQIVEWSIKDEFLHGQANSMLFRTYIQENQDIWDDELKFDVYEGIREIVSYEEALIDYLNPPHMDNTVLKTYVKFQADNALKTLGMKANYGIDTNPYPWMEEVTGLVLGDFFSGVITEYSKERVGSRDEVRKAMQSLR